MTGRMPYAIAHRGLSLHHRENTMGSIDAALAYGDVVEIDLRMCRDGVLICCHDETLARTHHVDAHIRDLTAVQLSELAPDVPTLDDVMDAFSSRCGWFLDCKDASVPEFREAVACSMARCGMSLQTVGPLKRGDQIPKGAAVLEAPSVTALEAMAQAYAHEMGIDPSLIGCAILVPTGPTTGQVVASIDSLRGRVHGAVAPLAIADGVVADACHGAGIGVYAYTVNRREDVARLMADGVDGFFTDRMNVLARADGAPDRSGGI